MGISNCVFSRDRVSLLIHVFDAELYVNDWHILLSVKKLNAAIEAFCSNFLKAATFSAVRNLQSTSLLKHFVLLV